MWSKCYTETMSQRVEGGGGDSGAAPGVRVRCSRVLGSCPTFPQHIPHPQDPEYQVSIDGGVLGSEEC